MILPEFEVLVPGTVSEACELLFRYHEKGARVLAGGTDLLVDLRQPVIPMEIAVCDGCATHKSGHVRTTIDCSLWDSDSSPKSDSALLTKVQGSIHQYPRYLISIHKIKELRGIKVEKNGSLVVGAMTTITEIERSAIIREKWIALS